MPNARRTERSRRAPELKLCLMAALFLLCLSVFSLAACAPKRASGGDGQTTQGVPEAGPENYDADVAWLRFEKVPDVGPSVVYHQVDKLETLVSATPRPIVLCIYDPAHQSAAMAIPFMERLSEQSGDKALVILAKKQAKDPFLRLIKQDGWPTFATIIKGQIVRRFSGYTDEMRQGIADFLKQHEAS